MLLLQFKASCEKICPDEKELCDIIIDLCYSSEKSKQFAWDVCSKTILHNLLEKNNYIISYPVLTNNTGEFEFGGEQFNIHTKILKGEEEISLY